MIFNDIDGTGESTVLRQRQSQRGDGIHDDVTFQCLIGYGYFCAGTVRTGSTPAVACAVAGDGHQSSVLIQIGEKDIVQSEDTMGVGDIEHIAIIGDQLSAGHGKCRGADIRVAGHGLIDHDVVNVFIGAGTLVVAHIAADNTILQSDRILTFNDQGLGMIGGQFRVFYCDIGRRIYCGRIVAVGGITSAVDSHGTAAPVRTDGCGRVARSGNGQIGCMGCTAASGLNTAGIVSSCSDDRIGDIYNGSFTVTEYAVSVLCGRIYSSIGNGDLRAVGSEQSRIDTVNRRFPYWKRSRMFYQR